MEFELQLTISQTKVCSPRTTLSNEGATTHMWLYKFNLKFIEIK